MSDSLPDALQSQLNALKTDSYVNTVMSGLIIILSIVKPIFLEWIKRRYARKQARKVAKDGVLSTDTTTIEMSASA
jgi:hypothetical protein